MVKTTFRTLANGYRFRVDSAKCANCGKGIVREFRDDPSPLWRHTGGNRMLSCNNGYDGTRATPKDV